MFLLSGLFCTLFGGVNGRLEMEAPKVLSFEKHEQRSLKSRSSQAPST